MEKESNNHSTLVLTSSFSFVLKCRVAPISRIWFAFISPYSAKTFGFVKEKKKKSGLFLTQMFFHLLNHNVQEWKPLILYLEAWIPTSL